MSRCLLLFDIDATLLTTRRAGIEAMETTGRARFGPSFSADGVDYAGRLDPLIIDDLLVANGVEPTESAHAALLEGYVRTLEVLLSEPGRARTLPGVGQLVRRLAERGEDCVLGLLTGNLAQTGSIKLRAAGLSPEVFIISAWGTESTSRPPSRNDLPGVAMRKYRERFEAEIPPTRVTVIGDTVHDIACARAHGCRVLAVATGIYGPERLSGADRVARDLSEVEDIEAWLLA